VSDRGFLQVITAVKSLDVILQQHSFTKVCNCGLSLILSHKVCTSVLYILIQPVIGCHNPINYPSRLPVIYVPIRLLPRTRQGAIYERHRGYCISWLGETIDMGPWLLRHHKIRRPESYFGRGRLSYEDTVFHDTGNDFHERQVRKNKLAVKTN